MSILIRTAKAKTTQTPTLTESKTIEVIGKILSKNDAQAAHNREHFDERGVLDTA